MQVLAPLRFGERRQQPPIEAAHTPEGGEHRLHHESQQHARVAAALEAAARQLTRHLPLTARARGNAFQYEQHKHKQVGSQYGQRGVRLERRELAELVNPQLVVDTRG